MNETTNTLRGNVARMLCDEFTNEIQTLSQSKKQNYTYLDALKYASIPSNERLISERSKLLIRATKYLLTDPLKNNDYKKYITAYIEDGIKLDKKYFKHDLDLLQMFYERADSNECKHNPFKVEAYEKYVYYMTLKMFGGLKPEDNEWVKAKKDDSEREKYISPDREYTPLTSAPRVYRGSLPFEVEEYDIKRAFPTFIDLELNTNYRHTAYDILGKREYSMFLNMHKDCKNKPTYKQAVKNLEPLYGARAEDVMTRLRYENSGRVFNDLIVYEREYIEQFIKANNIKHYARLHDAIIVPKGTKINTLTFGIVEFTKKELKQAPEVINPIKTFYNVTSKGTIETKPNMYADFLAQENFIRISNGDDRIQLIRNTNNVVDYFNHKTNIVDFLSGEIAEGSDMHEKVLNKIAHDNNTTLASSFLLLPATPLIYHKDKPKSFALNFKNGFFEYKDGSFTTKKIDEVNGFFTPHNTHKRTFEYTDKVGDFETFVQRMSTGVKNIETLEQLEDFDKIKSMIGYLVHNYKGAVSPAIVLTDEGATGNHRNGRRGKSLIYKALEQVTKTIVKGGYEFDPKYGFAFNDLDKSHNLYVLDDVTAGFDYNALYTNISGGINAQRKGKTAEMIEYSDSPKFLITSNYVLRCDKSEASTYARFYEYKIRPYYSIELTPFHEFQREFFGDEWEVSDWNEFYSFIFKCVQVYFDKGLMRTQYDKSEDNFNALFNSDVKVSEFERILNEISYNKDSFSVAEFLSIYNQFDNPLRNEKLFNQNNVKNLCNIYFQSRNIFNFVYNERNRRWYKEKKTLSLQSEERRA